MRPPVLKPGTKQTLLAPYPARCCATRIEGTVSKVTQHQRLCHGALHMRMKCWDREIQWEKEVGKYPMDYSERPIFAHRLRMLKDSPFEDSMPEGKVKEFACDFCHSVILLEIPIYFNPPADPMGVARGQFKD